MKGAAKSTAKLFDLRGNFLLVMSYVALFLLASFLLARGFLSLPIIENLIGDLNSEIRLVVAFSIVVFATLLLQAIYLPAKFDQEQKELITYYQNRHKVALVRLRAINRDLWVGIEVFNLENDLRIDIDSLIIKAITQMEVLSTPIQLVTERDRRISFRLPPNVWNTYMLARLNNDCTKAQIEGFSKSLSIEPGTYHILTQLDGQVEYDGMLPIEATWLLNFYHQGKLRLEKQENLVDV